MPRPVCCRRIGVEPGCRAFKPLGIPAGGLERIVLGLDEFEALRLADLEGLYQGDAAERMGVSRATFGRIVEVARRKVAEALVHGRLLLIEGGEVTLSESREFACRACGHAWNVAFGEPRPAGCPSCANADVRGNRAWSEHEANGPGRRQRCRRRGEG
ncbi:MAG: DUF134 domain-containing protein [Candidatus Hydrogenedentales bacterium]